MTEERSCHGLSCASPPAPPAEESPAERVVFTPESSNPMYGMYFLLRKDNCNTSEAKVLREPEQIVLISSRSRVLSSCSVGCGFPSSPSQYCAPPKAIFWRKNKSLLECTETPSRMK